MHKLTPRAAAVQRPRGAMVRGDLRACTAAPSVAVSHLHRAWGGLSERPFLKETVGLQGRAG
jgi:hypothetical protein